MCHERDSNMNDEWQNCEIIVWSYGSPFWITECKVGVSVGSVNVGKPIRYTHTQEFRCATRRGHSSRPSPPHSLIADLVQLPIAANILNEYMYSKDLANIRYYAYYNVDLCIFLWLTHETTYISSHIGIWRGRQIRMQNGTQSCDEIDTLALFSVFNTYFINVLIYSVFVSLVNKSVFHCTMPARSWFRPSFYTKFYY